MDGSIGDLPSSVHQYADRLPPDNSSSLKMPRRSSSLDDDPDLGFRRSSGRTRKLTSKYQALAGSKYLPPDSANHASEEPASPTRSSSSKAPPDTVEVQPQSRSRSTVSIEPPTSSAELLTNAVNVDTVTATLATSYVVEEPTKRASRRERKPTTKLLEASADPELAFTAEHSSRRASRRERKSTAKVLESQEYSPPPKQPPSPNKEVSLVEVEAVVVAGVHPISPAQVDPSNDAAFHKDQSTVLSKDAAQVEAAPSSRKRSTSNTKNPPRVKVPRLSRKHSPASDKLPVLEPLQNPASTETEHLKLKSSRLSLKPPRRPSNLGFAVSTAEDDTESRTGGTKEARIIFTAEGRQQSREQGVIINGRPFKPTKLVIIRRPKSSLSETTELADATPIRFSPFAPAETQDQQGVRTCNLLCLSPSSRILAFAQIAADLSDSDEDDEDSDEVDSGRISSNALYEKWIAIGRERFCVCNTTSTTHAHPPTSKLAQASGSRPPRSSTSKASKSSASKDSLSEAEKALIPNGVSESTLADPVFPGLRPEAIAAMSSPPVNSIVSASDGLRESAFYRAMADNPPAAPRLDLPWNGISKKSPAVPPRSVSYEELMSEDYRALEAMRQQAKMEGVAVTYDLRYGQIKALLDKHRMEASSWGSHAH
jgi:hypothetical protein